MPVLEETPDRLRALEGPQPRVGKVIHRVGGKQAHHGVKITATHGFVRLPREPHFIGGRGLLGHRAGVSSTGASMRCTRPERTGEGLRGIASEVRVPIVPASLVLFVRSDSAGSGSLRARNARGSGRPALTGYPR